jgi:hypothetical protein
MSLSSSEKCYCFFQQKMTQSIPNICFEAKPNMSEKFQFEFSYRLLGQTYRSILSKTCVNVCDIR